MVGERLVKGGIVLVALLMLATGCRKKEEQIGRAHV